METAYSDSDRYGSGTNDAQILTRNSRNPRSATRERETLQGADPAMASWGESRRSRRTRTTYVPKRLGTPGGPEAPLSQPNQPHARSRFRPSWFAAYCRATGGLPLFSSPGGTPCPLPCGVHARPWPSSRLVLPQTPPCPCASPQRT
jgi:hypothetical protein